MNASILEVSHLTKKFGPPAGGFTAVDDISFSVAEGEIVGLLGPNGAGKSTTIFMLLDLVSPTIGDIRILGLRYKNDREAILSRINYSSTYIELSPRLTVWENLLF
ncbi:MAG: ATP-binding cassette domain-containing protein, partial [Patescibacteria group bacterium]